MSWWLSGGIRYLRLHILLPLMDFQLCVCMYYGLSWLVPLWLNSYPVIICSHLYICTYVHTCACILVHTYGLYSLGSVILVPLGSVKSMKLVWLWGFQHGNDLYIKQRYYYYQCKMFSSLVVVIFRL